MSNENACAPFKKTSVTLGVLNLGGLCDGGNGRHHNGGGFDGVHLFDNHFFGVNLGRLCSDKGEQSVCVGGGGVGVFVVVFFA